MRDDKLLCVMLGQDDLRPICYLPMFPYQLLQGATKEQRENLGVTTPDYYFYLNQSSTYTVEDVNDKKEFEDTMVGVKHCILIQTTWLCSCHSVYTIS